MTAYKEVSLTTSQSDPILSHFRETTTVNDGGYNLGGINATGQVPVLPGVRGLVDEDTPEEVKTRVGFVSFEKCVT